MFIATVHVLGYLIDVFNFKLHIEMGLKNLINNKLDLTKGVLTGCSINKKLENIYEFRRSLRNKHIICFFVLLKHIVNFHLHTSTDIYDCRLRSILCKYI